MKKAFLILTLLAAFNFTSPNSQLSQTVRHTIEFSQEDKTRDLTENEILKNKVLKYMRLQMILIRITMINANEGFNTC